VGRPSPDREQQDELYEWLFARGEEVLTGGSFLHLGAYDDSLPGPSSPNALNLAVPGPERQSRAAK
jgi:hypothetical protein